MNNVNIYVIVVTWNGMKWIDRCLTSLRKSNIHVHTIVIDNGSKDNTISYIMSNFPEVQLIPLNANLGFGQANNYGIRIAIAERCDFVFLLNQDAYIYPDMFEKLLLFYTSASCSQNIGIISPLHLNSNSDGLDSQFVGYLRETANSIIEDGLLNRVKDCYVVSAVPAAGWLLPKETLLKIGGFNPLFFHYGEDHNYSQRINFHGMKTFVVPTAKMIHDREGFGNETMAKKSMFFRTVKTEIMLNINLRKSVIFVELAKYEVKYFICSLKYLMKGYFKAFFDCQRAVLFQLPYLAQYSKNRKLTKKIGSHWL